MTGASGLMFMVLMVVSSVAAYSNYYNYYYQNGYPTLCGLSALRGAAYYGYYASRRDDVYRYHKRRYRGPHQRSNKQRYGRSIRNPPSKEENLLLSAVGQLDHEGCILKLLCHLQTREEDARSLEENVLVDMFANITETSYNAPFIHALYIGTNTYNPTECNSYFSKCPLNDVQLGDLLQQAWSCGSNLYDDDLPQNQHVSAIDQDNLSNGTQNMSRATHNTSASTLNTSHTT
ncbi:hypothetical protein OTU49_003481 [Cherax quadricarinatus]|uniref:Uncharacterized protein n=1 Tax=Cherax quadricarinatus TaxID=27406 RepID=A0AAW0YNB7_CHEQU|nr:uncharacterized protein LOC128706647 [Cherax quadricarinatus]